MSLHGRKIAQKLAKCKVAGSCARQEVATDYLRSRVRIHNQRMETINEQYRDTVDLPRCPPDCLKEIKNV